MKKYINNFNKIKYNCNFKRVYNADIWKWFSKNKDTVFTVVDSEGESTHNTYSNIEIFFIKHTLKNGYLNKKDGVLYVETYNNRYGSITDKYIVYNKKLRLD